MTGAARAIERHWRGVRLALVIGLSVTVLGALVVISLPGGVDRLWADCSRKDWRIDIPGDTSLGRAADIDNCTPVKPGDSAARAQAVLGKPVYSSEDSLSYQPGQTDGFRTCSVTVLFDDAHRVRTINTRGCPW